MGAPGDGRRFRRLEGRLWSGRLAHLVGGGLDLAQALARHALGRPGGRAR